MNPQTKTKTNRKNYHLNIPQLLYSAIKPQLGVCIWARFAGKTDGPAADFCLNNVLTMPGSNGFIQAKTYAHLEGMTLDGLISAWEKRGYYRDVHFWVGRFPPKKLRIPIGIRRPVKPDRYITWYNGSGIYLVSQDKTSSINGVRTHWGLIDEARLIDKIKFDEHTLPTMAGGFVEFGHMSNYHSLLFCSDMPQHSSEKWLLDFEKLVDHEQIEVILQTQMKISQLKLNQIALVDKQEENGELTAEEKKQFQTITNSINKYSDKLNELRKKSVYFSEASAIENIHAVGLDPILNQKRTLNDIRFRVQILNQRIIKNEKGFYGLLDPKTHGDCLIDYAYVDTLRGDLKRSVNQDCRWDADIVRDKPLCIAFDHNNAINCVVTGQMYHNTLRLLSSKYVLHPEFISQCVKQWHDYYKTHPNKELHYYYDATSTDERGNGEISYADEIFNQLLGLGWNVIRKHIGQIGSHHSRYLLYSKLFSGDDKRLPVFIYNQTNCKSWESSALGAGYKKVGNKYEKDKSSEKDKNVLPQDATHISEAGDILIWGLTIEKFKGRKDMVSFLNN